MQPTTAQDTQRYAKCIEVSKRVCWDIDRDVIRGRRFDLRHKFLPDGLSQVDRMNGLDAAERRLMSQIQGRTYANMFGLVERFIGAKLTEIGHSHALGDQTAFEAIVRFIEEELKHQELFRRIEALAAEGMPPGYRFLPQANEIAAAVLGKSTWAVLALTCHIELFSQAHYRESIAFDAAVSALWRDVFFFHWKEESQHAVLDEMEWGREDARLSPAERDRGVDELIELMRALDGLLAMQAAEDTAYFARVCGRRLSASGQARLGQAVLRAYRWQYIGSGTQAELRRSARTSHRRHTGRAHRTRPRAPHAVTPDGARPSVPPSTA